MSNLLIQAFAMDKSSNIASVCLSTVVRRAFSPCMRFRLSAHKAPASGITNADILFSGREITTEFSRESKEQLESLTHYNCHFRFVTTHFDSYCSYPCLQNRNNHEEENEFHHGQVVYQIIAVKWNKRMGDRGPGVTINGNECAHWIGS